MLEEATWVDVEVIVGLAFCDWDLACEVLFVCDEDRLVVTLDVKDWLFVLDDDAVLVCDIVAKTLGVSLAD